VDIADERIGAALRALQICQPNAADATKALCALSLELFLEWLLNESRFETMSQATEHWVTSAPGAGRPAGKSANTSPVSTRARAPRASRRRKSKTVAGRQGRALGDRSADPIRQFKFLSARRIAMPRRIWDAAGNARGTPVATYLAGRGITVDPPPPLRWAPALAARMAQMGRR
jgi:hypothetical protein